jgi:hypothetical protein
MQIFKVAMKKALRKADEQDFKEQSKKGTFAISMATVKHDDSSQVAKNQKETWLPHPWVGSGWSASKVKRQGRSKSWAS